MIDHIPGCGSLMLTTLAELGMCKSSVRPSLLPTTFPGGQTRTQGRLFTFSAATAEINNFSTLLVAWLQITRVKSNKRGLTCFLHGPKHVLNVWIPDVAGICTMIRGGKEVFDVLHLPFIVYFNHDRYWCPSNYKKIFMTVALD